MKVFDISTSGESINLARLESFRVWTEKISRIIHSMYVAKKINGSAARVHLEHLRGEQFVYRWKGPASLLTYVWDTGEPKLLPVIKGEYIVGTSEYWLNQYPFLRMEKDVSNRAFYLSKDYLHFGQKCSKSCMVLGDNNHFGHFLLDCLPLACLFGATTDTNHLLNMYVTFPYKESIVSAFIDCMGNLVRGKTPSGLQAAMPEQLNNQYTEWSFSDLTYYTQTSTYASYFIWRKAIYPRIRNQIISTGQMPRNKSLCKDQKLEKIWLIRGSNYESRIHNYPEVEEVIRSLGYVQMDPSEISFTELCVVLANARSVVSECGSSLLNCAMLTSDNCHITALIPSRLLEDTDSDMIFGGLPYLLPFIDRVNIVLGETIINMGVQSSDIAYYDPMLVLKGCLTTDNSEYYFAT